MNPKLPFVLFKKTGKSGNKIWYYSVYDENNKRHQFSTHTIKKSQAILYCLELYKSNKLLRNRAKPKQKNELILKNYAKDWFIYDKCPYIKEKKAYGFSVTIGYAHRRRQQFETHILPYFGNYLITDITKDVVFDWILYLREQRGLSNSTINNHIKGLKIFLSYAYNKGDIPTDVSKSIKLLKNDSKTHGIFTKEEIEQLTDKTRLNEMWRGNIFQYALNFTAIKTGMRRGEIQGLQKQNVKSTYIIVENNWDPQFGLKDTKNHKTRNIPISAETYRVLSEVIAKQTNGNFVFSHSKGKTPVPSHAITDYFNFALDSIGVNEEERDKRYLTFHSYRHYVNTLLITSGVPINIVQSIIGHVDDDKMTEHYTHLSLEDQKAALEFL